MKKIQPMKKIRSIAELEQMTVTELIDAALHQESNSPAFWFIVGMIVARRHQAGVPLKDAIIDGNDYTIAERQLRELRGKS